LPKGGRPLAGLSNVHVPLGADSYDIAVGASLYGELGRLFPPRPGQRGCVIAPENLVGEYAEPVLEGLRAGGWEAELLPVIDGEQAKNLQTAGELCRHLAQRAFDRGSVVFALGGGVVGDLAGFVASIYLRGIAFVQLPTTLLAQVDASVGGKVAVDLPEGKNLVGAFHQPAAVFMDTDALKTLPDRQLRSGMAEIIKHAVIADGDLFAYVEENLQRAYAREPEALKHLLVRNCQIKVDIVTQDPLDTGRRSLLNLGHTVGHALEVAAEDWGLHHGEAVAIGMVAEGRLSVRLGKCDREALDRLERLIAAAGLQAETVAVDIEMAREALRRDKKIADGALRLPLMTGIGSAEILAGVPMEQVDAALREALDSNAR